jgi:hypothetical protein
MVKKVWEFVMSAIRPDAKHAVEIDMPIMVRYWKCQP